MRRRTRGVSTVVTALLAGAVLAACGGSESDGADGLQRVRLGWGGTAALPAHAPYTSLPVILGYWQEEGLDVEVMGFDGSTPAIQALDAGQLDLTFAGGPPFITAVGAGTTNLVGVFAQITGNPLIPTVPVDSPIQTVDIAGKRVGISSLESASVFMIRGMLQSEGVDPESVEFLAVGTGPEAAVALEQGDVDVLALTDATHAEIENLGTPLRPISNEYADLIGFQNPLIVPRDTLAESPEIAVGIARGVVKAMIFMDENPEAAIRLHWEVFPESKPTGVDDEEAMRQALVVQRARAAITQPVEELWGNSTPEIVRAHIDFLAAAGQLGEPVEVADVWTPELIEEINDVDQEAIRTQAAEYQS